MIEIDVIWCMLYQARRGMVRVVVRRVARLRGVRLGTQPPRAAGRRGGRQGALARPLRRARRTQPRAARRRGADFVRGHARWKSLRYWYVLKTFK